VGCTILVGGFKHFDFSISYMGCHPKPSAFHIFQDGYCTTKQQSETMSEYQPRGYDK
jgi:Cu/Zn superoxide dismutase